MNQRSRNIANLIGLLSFVSLLAACGGGGFAPIKNVDQGSSTPPPRGGTPTPTPTPPPVSQVGKIMQIDVSSTGALGNGPVSGRASFSEDGRYVAFVSAATNLVPNDNNGVADVFVRDLLLNTTIRVSVSSVGTEADGPSSDAQISGNGRYVVFATTATNLIPSDTNGRTDVYRRDMLTGITELVSVTNGGAQSNADSMFPSISAQGDLIAFVSLATNLVSGITDGIGTEDAFLKNMTTGGVTFLTEHRDAGGNRNSATGAASMGTPRISTDGSVVVFHSSSTTLVDADTNSVRDVFRFKIADDSLTRVNLSELGNQWNGDSWAPSVSGNGRYITVHTDATTATEPNDTDTFYDVLRIDTMTGAVEELSLTSTGASPSGDCYESSVASDGSMTAFQCNATDLVPNDTNNKMDIFVRSSTGNTTIRVSQLADGADLNDASELGTLSGNLKKVVFNSVATNVPDASTDGQKHLYVKILAD